MTEATIWAGILRIYDAPGVAPLCLRLQDEGGIDVMLLLCLCHAARQNAALTPAEVDALIAGMEPWRQAAVRPLRALRIALRAPVPAVPDALRESVRTRLKAAELESERVQAALFADWLSRRPTPGTADARPGLRHLLRAAAVTEAELDLLLSA